MPAEIYVATLLPIVLFTTPMLWWQLTSLENRRRHEDEKAGPSASARA